MSNFLIMFKNFNGERKEAGEGQIYTGCPGMQVS